MTTYAPTALASRATRPAADRFRVFAAVYLALLAAGVAFFALVLALAVS